VIISAKEFLTTGANRIRRLFRSGSSAPDQLQVEKCLWMHDATAPVVFMIDDFTNAWFDNDGDGVMGPGEDWGAGGRKENGVIAFLEGELLRGYPEPKMTLFAVVGKMSPFRTDCAFTYSGRMDEKGEALRAFRSLFFDDRYEIAYHGLDHGESGKVSKQFRQEWLTFGSLREALERIEQGKRIYLNAFGSPPAGGKYCGYKLNEHSDASIDASGFKWWCRCWFPKEAYRDKSGACFDLRFFGDNRVVDIPSNLHGMHWRKKQIAQLIKRRQIIAIQEHIAPHRVDGRTQTPNIVDDMKRLRQLFDYLSGSHVWYATCGDVADYFRAYRLSTISDVSENGFSIEYAGDSTDAVLTLSIDARSACSPERPYVRIRLPNGCILAGQQYRYDITGYRHQATLPVMGGRYEVRACKRAEERLEGWIGDDDHVRFNHERMAGEVEVAPAGRHHGYWISSRDRTRKPARRTAGGALKLFCSDSSDDIMIETFED
jgi:hypothetical protein